MAKLPTIPTRGSRATAQMMDAFLGYEHKKSAREGAWYEQQNMTAEAYPVLASRRLRRTGSTLTAPAGMIAKDALAVIDGTAVVYNGYRVELGLSTAAAKCPKQLLSMGAYLLIWPDKKYLNTKDLSDKGSMENRVTVSGTVTISLCRQDGTAYGSSTASSTAPADPTAGQLWIDTSNSAVPVLKEWSADSAMWVTIPTTYLRLQAQGIGAGFELYDGVTLSGLTGAAETLNGSHALYAVGEDYLVIVGILNSGTTMDVGVTVERTVPDMDFVTECDNRIWGCKYGMVDGEVVNEIYASKLGDFKNWGCYMGLSTDSYAAGRGSDGVFTGAVTHQGHPLFFRENCIEKVYPSETGAHQIVTTEARGVQRGCWRSLVIVGETLYYKSRSDVCAYTGALPVSVSEALGDTVYSDARAGAAGEKYYLSMADGAGAWHLFTYDTARGIWSREDDTHALCFAAVDGEMWWIDEETGTLRCASGDAAGPVAWSVTSGVIGFDLAENEYISRLAIRCETAGQLHVELQYDEGAWQDKGTFRRQGLGSIFVPVAPRRCDHLRLRLSGDESVRIYSIAKYVERGSDVMR